MNRVASPATLDHTPTVTFRARAALARHRLKAQVPVIAAVPSIGRAARVEREADADATHGLYERYSGQILGFCVNQLGSRDEGEDAMQSTFLNAHRAIQRGVKPESEVAWLYKIAHNVCLTRRRSRYRRGRLESPSDLAAVQDALPAPQRESGDDLIRLTDGLAQMPENQRYAILLREWQGLSYAEIARILDVSQSAVETLIFRARRSLAANLEAEPPQKKPRLLSRARRAVDAGSIALAIKTLFEGGAAAKAAVVAVAVTGTAVVTTAPPRVAPERPPKAPAHVERAKAAPEPPPAANSAATVDVEEAAAVPTAVLTPPVPRLREQPAPRRTKAAEPAERAAPPAVAADTASSRPDAPTPAPARDAKQPEHVDAAAPQGAPSGRGSGKPASPRGQLKNAEPEPTAGALAPPLAATSEPTAPTAAAEPANGQDKEKVEHGKK